MFQRKSGSGGGRCRTAFRQRIAGLITACAALAIITTAQAQSSRPGWGSTPYHDALGTCVTFRVWAPNATSVFVPGQFNNWSTAATPLGKDLTNGVWDGVWSADVAAAVPGQQYKYYINYSGGSAWKHDPRARMVVNSSDAAAANDIIYDPTAFNWLGDSLTPPALADLVVYELHIGAFYDPNSGSSLPGKFTDATNRLDYLKSLVVSAVEVLPIAELPGYYIQMWLDECHVDGFRWDTPGLMMNDGSTFINDAATLISTITGMVHTNYPGRIDIAEDVTGYGFDGTWDLNFHNYVTPQLADAADASRDMTAIAYAVTNNTLFNFSAGLNRVVFLESHDVVGDLNNGVRLPTAIDTNTPDSYRARKLSTLGAALTFTSPGVPMFFEGQEMLENQQFSSSRPVDWTKTNTYSRIVLLYHDLIRLRRNVGTTCRSSEAAQQRGPPGEHIERNSKLGHCPSPETLAAAKAANYI